MDSTSPLCRDDRLQRRHDLVVRALPEIRLCMVYRPRPARIVTLNPWSWLLFEACAGCSVDQIEQAAARAAGAARATPDAVRRGLRELMDLSLVVRCGDGAAIPIANAASPERTIR